jgi:hypothetical protein
VLDKGTGVYFFHENGNFFRAEKKVKKKKIIYFYSKSPLLDVGGFAKQGIKKYSPYITSTMNRLHA